MTVKLPLPKDVDLSDMPYFPVNDPRLKKSKSWRRAKHWRGTGPGLGFCLFNLWTAAFRAVPAGSLPDDDDDLAEDAECDIAYWLSIKADVLKGWELIDGRWWHHVVAEIAWDLWVARTKKKHENAIESWRSACKRAADKGLEPPPPPGIYRVWLSARYPETSATMSALDGREQGPVSEPCRTDVGATKEEIQSTKDLSEAKVSRLTPYSPPPRTKSPEGKNWYVHELARLTNEIGPGRVGVLVVEMAEGKGRGSGQYRLVEALKGGFMDARGVLVLPSKRRVDRVIAKWGDVLAACAPPLTLRHATVDELRAKKARIVA